ncbi:MAG: hypothetical protein KDB90_11280 [Planctomycetes bacterium]|nr:hypothetical protein [Planctomycetota bacterium]
MVLPKMTVRQMQIYAALCVWAYCEAKVYEEPGLRAYVDHLLSVALMEDVVLWDESRTSYPDEQGDPTHDTLAKRLQADEFAEFKDLVTHATEVGKTDMFTVDSDKPAQELEHCIKILTRCSVPLPNIKPLVGYCKPGKFHAHWGDTIFASDLEDLLAAYDYPADEGRTTD